MAVASRRRTRLRALAQQMVRPRRPLQGDGGPPQPSPAAHMPDSPAASPAAAPNRAPDTSSPEPEPQSGAGPESTLPPGWLELLGAAGSLLSLLTAVLFYFGWASTDAETRALGLRDTVLRLSTIDYLLRSVDALFLPAALVAAAALAGTGLHRWVTQDPGRAEAVTRTLRFAWLPPVALMVLLPRFPLLELLVPLALIPGFLLTTYARTLSRAGEPSSAADRRRKLRLWALTVLISVLALFWAISAYAGMVGRSRAETAARSVDTAFPSVVVFSEKDLLIRGDGTCFNRIEDKDSAYGFRHAGLRLFHVSGDRVFLVGSDWTPGRGTLWVIEKDDSLRVEFADVKGRPAKEC
ncbi:hypothetical protein GCM10023086_39240 [Streptomyces venetus]|uniref:Uncharacterized protein n=2 Tax=Streptomyces venetus TaxID=1701086 RepID=A0ABP8G3N7_9ACTN